MALSTESRRGKWWRRLFQWRLLLDQVLMILDMPTLSDSLELRIERLRRVYYSDPQVTMDYRRVRDIVRGHVAKDYWGYYERLLAGERATFFASRKLGLQGSDLLRQTQRLGDKIARLIDEVQDLDQLLTLYPRVSTAAQNVQKARQALIQRIEDALNMQSDIPARMLSLGTVKAERGIDQLQQSIRHLAQTLDDIAATYDEMDANTDWDAAQASERLGES